jgi:hypothetical protein
MHLFALARDVEQARDALVTMHKVQSFIILSQRRVGTLLPYHMHRTGGRAGSL